MRPKSSTAHRACPWGAGVRGKGGGKMILEEVEGEKGSETPAQGEGREGLHGESLGDFNVE